MSSDRNKVNNSNNSNCNKDSNPTLSESIVLLTSTLSQSLSSSSSPSLSESKQLQVVTHTPYRSAGGRGTKSCPIQVKPSSVQHFLPSKSSSPRRKFSSSFSNFSTPIASSKPLASGSLNHKHHHLQRFDNHQKVLSQYKELEYLALSSRSLVTKAKEKLDSRIHSSKQNKELEQLEEEERNDSTTTTTDHTSFSKLSFPLNEIQRIHHRKSKIELRMRKSGTTSHINNTNNNITSTRNNCNNHYLSTMEEKITMDHSIDDDKNKINNMKRTELDIETANTKNNSSCEEADGNVHHDQGQDHNTDSCDGNIDSTSDSNGNNVNNKDEKTIIHKVEEKGNVTKKNQSSSLSESSSSSNLPIDEIIDDTYSGDDNDDADVSRVDEVSFYQNNNECQIVKEVENMKGDYEELINECETRSQTDHGIEKDKHPEEEKLIADDGESPLTRKGKEGDDKSREGDQGSRCDNKCTTKDDEKNVSDSIILPTMLEQKSDDDPITQTITSSTSDAKNNNSNENLESEEGISIHGHENDGNIPNPSLMVAAEQDEALPEDENVAGKKMNNGEPLMVEEQDEVIINNEHVIQKQNHNELLSVADQNETMPEGKNNVMKQINSDESLMVQVVGQDETMLKDKSVIQNPNHNDSFVIPEEDKAIPVDENLVQKSNNHKTLIVAEQDKVMLEDKCIIRNPHQDESLVIAKEDEATLVDEKLVQRLNKDETLIVAEQDKVTLEDQSITQNPHQDESLVIAEQDEATPEDKDLIQKLNNEETLMITEQNAVMPKDGNTIQNPHQDESLVIAEQDQSAPEDENIDLKSNNDEPLMVAEEGGATPEDDNDVVRKVKRDEPLMVAEQDEATPEDENIVKIANDGNLITSEQQMYKNELDQKEEEEEVNINNHTAYVQSTNIQRQIADDLSDEEEKAYCELGYGEEIVSGEDFESDITKEIQKVSVTDETRTQPSTSINFPSTSKTVDAKHEKNDIAKNSLPTEVNDDELLNQKAGLEFGPSQIQWTNSERVEDDNDSIENESGMGSVHSSGVVSSITNFSAAASISTFGSSRSLGPTMQQLDHIASNSTMLNVPPFTPANRKLKIDHIKKEKYKNNEKSPFLVWSEIYECETEQDATNLAIEQANCLDNASTHLVNTLFQYLHKYCGVSEEELQLKEVDHESNFSNSNPSLSVDMTSSFYVKSKEEKGLILPATAIGWLASHLFPTDEDTFYFEQFQHQRSGSFLIDPNLSIEMKEKLQCLSLFLASKVTNLRVSGAPWPPVVVKDKGKPWKRTKSKITGIRIDSESTKSFLAYYRYLQNRPHIDMRLFPSLTYLSLEGVVPENVTHLEILCQSLKRMTIQRGCIVNVPNLLSCGEFSSLNHLDLSRCAINELAGLSGKRLGRTLRNQRGLKPKRPPLAFMKDLISLDLSHNQLIYQESALAGLSVLTNLIKVDLSYNSIESMDQAHIMMGNIQVLNLSHNCIKNVSGIDRLYSLERLSIESNQIASLADVAGLAKLPELMYLYLKGNPLEKDGVKMSYRIKLLNLFKEARFDKNDKKFTYRDLIALLPYIDDIEVSKKELVALRNLTFSQSVGVTKKDDEQYHTSLLPGSMSILEPFRDEYKGPDGSTLASTLVTTQGHKPTTRKSRRRQVQIADSNETEEKRSDIKEKIVKHKSRTRTKSNSERISNDYPMLEIVLQTIYKKRDENLARPKTPTEVVTSIKTLPEETDIGSNEIEEDVDNNLASNDIDSILNQIDAALVDPIILYQKIEPLAKPLKQDSDSSKNESADICEDSNTISTISDAMKQITGADNESDLTSNKLTEEKSAQAKLLDTFNFAIAERNASYDGPDKYSTLLVSSYLELYFKTFVFPPSSLPDPMDFYDESNVIQETQLPRIQLYQTDRDLMMWTIAQNTGKGLSAHLHDNGEKLIALSNEKVIPCGIAATGRIAPVESEAKGVRGGTWFDEGKPYLMSEYQDLLLCISNKAVYFIPSTVGKTNKKNRRFPGAIPSKAKFEDAKWPHAYCRHPLKFLKKITFDGFGFQRLTLHFKLPSLRGEVYVQPESGGLLSAFDYTYVIFSCNQKRTIELMQIFQREAKEASPNNGSEVSTVQVENDDNGILLAISKALAPKTFNDDILHYHILTQIWQTNDTKGSRRTFVVTNERIFLFHETYTGDGLGYAAMISDDSVNVENGNATMRSVASSKLSSIADICILDEDSRIISITIKGTMRRTSRWILLCKDSENAERLVQDVRKAMNM